MDTDTDIDTDTDTPILKKSRYGYSGDKKYFYICFNYVCKYCIHKQPKLIELDTNSS